MLSLAYDSPTETVQQADRLLGEVLTSRERATCGRALGIALRILGDAVRSEQVLGRALEQARICGDHELEALTGMTLAVTLLYRGRSDESLALFEAARTKVDGVTRALVTSEQGGALLRLGRTADGLALLDDALPVLLGSPDPTDAADLLTNRGIARTFLGDLDGAEQDLSAAQDLYAGVGARLHAARMTWNLAFVASRRGNIAHALALFERATSEISESGGDAGEMATDRCGVLLTAGLATEAREFAVAAVAGCRVGGREADLAEALLLLARCAIADGEPAQARAAANEAASLFEVQRRHVWARQAAVLSCRTRIEEGDITTALADELDDHASVLRRVDGHAANEAQVLRLLALARLGQHNAVTLGVQQVAADLPIELDVCRALALAISERDQGERVYALDIVRAGLSSLDRHRAVLASTELRTHVATHVVQLAQLGISLALDRGDPDEVLGAVEAQRAQALRFQRLSPPGDLVLADLLTQLRQTLARRRESAGDASLSDEFDRERGRLERAIQAQARHEQSILRHLDIAATREGLEEALQDDEILVEMFAHGTDLLALVIGRGHARVAHLGQAADFDRSVLTMPRAYWRVISLTADDRLLQQSAGQLDAIAQKLDRLLRPLVNDAGRVVLSPTAAHHAVPWRLVPALAERPVAIVPSATTFLEIRRRPTRARSSLLAVAGPDLAYATEEVDAVAALYPKSEVLARAEADQVARSLSGADVAHFACHGRFRHGNPMLSALSLYDGPLTVYDLERARRLPDVVVLSSCHLGLSGAFAGDELAGLTQVLLGMGTRNVIASVTATPDSPATVELMASLHRHLAMGTAPTDAMVRAAAESTPEAAAVAAAFGVFGA